MEVRVQINLSIELVLEPMGFRPARIYQRALFEASIPLTAFVPRNSQREMLRWSFAATYLDEKTRYL